MRRSTRFAAMVVGLLGFGSAAAGQALFYVRPAPYGNDANGGMAANQAMATLVGVRDRVRAYRAVTDYAGPFIVNVGGGVYELPDTFILEAADSGTGPLGTMTYRAANLGDPLGATAIISGGTAVSGWTLSGGLYTANWNPSPTPEQRPRDLYRSSGAYYEGARLSRARYPNVDPVSFYSTPQWLKVATHTTVSGTPYFQITAATNDSCYTNPNIPQDGGSDDAGVEIVSRRRWVAPRQLVLVSGGHQWTSTWVRLFRELGSGFSNIGIQAGDEFYLEGAKEWADVEGEWACTIPAGGDKLHVKSTTDPDTSIMVAPRLATLIRLEQAHHVSFESIIFCYTNRAKLQYGYNSVMSGHAAEDMPEAGLGSDDQMLGGAVEFWGTENCVMSGCSVLNTGGHGVVVQSYEYQTGTWAFADGNLIIGCELKDLGACGVYIGSLKDPYNQDHEGNMWPNIARGWVLDTTVAECRIRGYGAAFHDCAGILARKTDETLISHNEIASLSGSVDPLYSRYSGIIALSFNQSHMPHSHATTIEYNNIHHVMSRLSDGGGIYVQGWHPDSAIRGNWIHAMPRDTRLVRDCLTNVGLYFDLGARGFHVEDNLLEGIGNYGFNPVNPYCPTVPSFECPEPSRVGTLQFNTKGNCCSALIDFKPPDCATVACITQTRALPQPPIQTWPTTGGLINYMDHEFTHLVPDATVPVTSYDVFDPPPATPPARVPVIRANAGP